MTKAVIATVAEDRPGIVSELSKIVPEHQQFARVAKFIGNKRDWCKLVSTDTPCREHIFELSDASSDPFQDRVACEVSVAVIDAFKVVKIKQNKGQRAVCSLSRGHGGLNIVIKTGPIA